MSTVMVMKKYRVAGKNILRPNHGLSWKKTREMKEEP